MAFDNVFKINGLFKLISYMNNSVLMVKLFLDRVSVLFYNIGLTKLGQKTENGDIT